QSKLADFLAEDPANLRVERFEFDHLPIVRSDPGTADAVVTPRMTLQELFYRLGDLAGRHERRGHVAPVDASGDDPKTGVWMSNNRGASQAPARRLNETEIMVARGEDEARAEQARRALADSGEVVARETEQPKTVEPRIERYRDR